MLSSESSAGQTADVEADPSGKASSTSLHHRQSLFPDSFRVLKLQARQSKYRERNARFHNDKGYGRRLLGGKSTRNERRRRRFRVATKAMRERRWKKHKKANAKGCAKMPAPPVQATTPAPLKAVPQKCNTASASGCLTEFSGTAKCAARQSGGTKAVPLRKDEWKFMGPWTWPWHTKRFPWFGLYLKMGSPGECDSASKNAGYCAQGTQCILLNMRMGKTFKTAPERAAASAPLYQSTTAYSGWPRVIGKAGECFSKCRDIPFFVMDANTRADKGGREDASCRYAAVLKCKTPAGKLGFVDRRTGAWRRCYKMLGGLYTSSPPKLLKDGAARASFEDDIEIYRI